MKTCTYHNQTFKFNLYVLVDAANPDAVQVWARRRRIVSRDLVLERPGEGALASCFLISGGDTVMAFWKGRSWRSHSIVSHECTHAAVWALESCGVPLTYENDETLAYVQQWCVNKALRTLGVSDEF